MKLQLKWSMHQDHFINFTLKLISQLLTSDMHVYLLPVQLEWTQECLK
jgi:hypothetical protein